MEEKLFASWFLVHSTPWLVGCLTLVTGRLWARTSALGHCRPELFTPGLALCRGGNKKSNEGSVKPGVVIAEEIMHGCLNRGEQELTFYAIDWGRAALRPSSSLRLRAPTSLRIPLHHCDRSTWPLFSSPMYPFLFSFYFLRL